LGQFSVDVNKLAVKRWRIEQVAVDRLTLDFDSTVMTRDGEQQVAARGYNPTKPGCLSHHPLMAFVSDTRMVANCWLRPGNHHTTNNACAFLDSALGRPGSKRVALLRADSGFSDNAFLEELAQK